MFHISLCKGRGWPSSVFSSVVSPSSIQAAAQWGQNNFEVAHKPSESETANFGLCMLQAEYENESPEQHIFAFFANSMPSSTLENQKYFEIINYHWFLKLFPH